MEPTGENFEDDYFEQPQACSEQNSTPNKSEGVTTCTVPEQPLACSEQHSTPNKSEEVTTCTVCNHEFIFREFKKHKASKDHKRAKNKLKMEKRQTNLSMVVTAAPASEIKTPDDENEKFYYRDGIKLPAQSEQYETLLTAFLSLRLSLNNEYKNLKVSKNDKYWDLFGDIVIETLDQDNDKEIQAIQCKQVQNRNDISISAISGEKGKFSLKKQLEILSKLKKRANYENTFFKLFTLSKVKIDGNMFFVFDDNVLKNWDSVRAKEQWKGKKAVIALFKKNNPINTTDDPDNICIFKLLNENGIISEEEEKDLCKFSLFMNQKKSLSLKHLMRMMIQDKFGNTRDITEDIIKFFTNYFKVDQNCKYNYKMTKRVILLKIAELLLTPYMLFSEDTIEGSVVKLWDDIVQKFDIIVVKNEEDTVHKVYNSINFVLQTKCGSINNCAKSFTITKKTIPDENVKFEIFKNSEFDIKKVTLPHLYITLWKLEFAPLVLMVENEDSLALIIKIINFLHAENLPLKFVLATKKDIHPSYFPDNLKTLTNLEDLRRIDNDILEQILNSVKIPFLNFVVDLKDLVYRNPDLLIKISPEALLNMFFDDYSFRDFLVPLTDDIVDNTLVVDDQVMTKIKNYFTSNNVATGTKNLSYLVHVNDGTTCFEVPPDI